jgi:outer membrane protein TolC
MKNHKLQQIKVSIFFLFCIAGRVVGQQNENDSLELVPLINRVIHTFPTVQQATEALNAADIKIAIARSAYLPNAQFTGSFAHIGPVPSLTLPDVGSFSLAPTNNVNAAISVNQTLYDFGKTKKNIEYEERGKELSSLGINQIKQRISLAVIACYYNLLFYQEAVTIKEAQILTLKEHLRNVEKKVETGTSTQYEVLRQK